MALYHKYRPQTFADIIGQDHIIQTIVNQVKTTRVAHAYLFSGSRGTGKTTLARILAKTINCAVRKDSKEEPCNTCSSCQEISDSRSIDVLEIDAASHTGVDNVRENIIDSAQFRPTKSKYKVFIIDEAHMLSTAAFNALLKTLEEPPEHIVFILATTELAKLPETIVSRCQRYDFHKVTFEFLKKHLEYIAKEEGIKVDAEVIERLINKSDGAVRDAISLLDQIIASGEKHITEKIASLVLPTTNPEKTLGLVRLLLNRELNPAILFLNELTETGINLQQFSHEVLELLRLIMVIGISGQQKSFGLDLDQDKLKEIKKLSQKIPSQELIQLIDLWLIRKNQIKSSPLPQLPLELAIVEWCGTLDNKNTANTNDETLKTKSDAQSQPEEKTEKKSVAKIVAEQVEKIVSKNIINRDQVADKWNAFISRIENDHPSLAFILKMAEIHSLENNNLELAVAHNFHRDKLMEKSYQKKLENIWEELLNEKIKLNVIVVETATVPTEDAEIEELASSLGGEIV